jgi:hypothetical protein
VSTRLPNLASIFAACHLLFFRITILRISELSLSDRLHSLAFTCTVSFVLRAPSVTCPFKPCSPRLLTSAQQSPLRCLPPWTACWIKNGADTSRSDLTRPRASIKNLQACTDCVRQSIARSTHSSTRHITLVRRSRKRQSGTCRPLNVVEVNISHS